jgi:uncharacterized protein (TIGR00369 family)
MVTSDTEAAFLQAGLPEPAPCSQTLGFELLSLDIKAGTARVRFEGKPGFLNPMGTVQGGYLAAMLDDVMGMMAMLVLKGRAVASTIDLHIHYLRPVRPGPIEVAATITNKGPSVLFAEAQLYDSRGKPAAKATSALAVTPVRARSASNDTINGSE